METVSNPVGSATNTLRATAVTVTIPGPIEDTLASEPRAIPSSSFAENSRIGNYVLRAKLGEGAMGVVYGAFDTKLDRKVAIKLLKRQAEPRARHRFLREAQAMARLSHPNVAQVYEIDEIDGIAFIVMEFVRGLSLAEWLTRESPTPAAILDAFLAAGRGLAAAHARGLVHRDFKPHNVMVNRDGRVLVMDFGLAREWDTDGSSTAGLRAGALLDKMTVQGEIMGTPAYMAPEQFDGLETDARTDQFSFCVALWEAIYGQRPFEASTMLELACAVKTHQVVSPPQPDALASWQHEAILRGLSAKPDERWPSMEALMHALQTEPQPSAAQPPKHQRVSALAWLLGLAVLVIVGLVAVIARLLAGS